MVHDVTVVHDAGVYVVAHDEEVPWGWISLTPPTRPLIHASVRPHGVQALIDRAHSRLAAPCRPPAPLCTPGGECWCFVLTVVERPRERQYQRERRLTRWLSFLMTLERKFMVTLYDVCAKQLYSSYWYKKSSRCRISVLVHQHR